jgi:hypothetical protein
VRLERDQEYIEAMEAEVKKFLSEVDEMFAKLKERK